MPIFEFECRECGKVFEELVRTSTPGDMECPHCHAKKATKRMSTFAARTAASSAPAETGGCADGSCCFGGNCGL